MNMFENHELVVEIHKSLRDHGVLKNDATLNTLTSEERAFLEAIDKDIERCIDDAKTEAHDDGYAAGLRHAREGDK